MNVIIAYLETMFTPYPKTPRLLEAKAELQAMMEDAYSNLTADGMSENEAIGKVITDFGNLDELAPVLGITSELAPVAAMAQGSPQPGGPTTPQYPPVTLDEAQGFAEAQRRTRFRLSIAVSLFVLAAAPIITLPSAAQAKLIGIDQNTATIVSLLMLFLLVAVGVVMIIGLSREFAPYNRLREGKFARNPAVTTWAQSLAEKHERGRILALQLAVVCWVLSAAPLLLLTLITQNSPLQGVWSTVGVALTLAMVALGLLILLPATWAHTVAETLTQGAGFTGESTESERSVVGVIASFYWPLLTAIYLGWSFIGNAWGDSWIIWPIGAVLFGAIAAGSGAIESYRKAKNRTQ